MDDRVTHVVTQQPWDANFDQVWFHLPPPSTKWCICYLSGYCHQDYLWLEMHPPINQHQYIGIGCRSCSCFKLWLMLFCCFASFLYIWQWESPNSQHPYTWKKVSDRNRCHLYDKKSYYCPNIQVFFPPPPPPTTNFQVVFWCNFVYWIWWNGAITLGL